MPPTYGPAPGSPRREADPESTKSLPSSLLVPVLAAFILRLAVIAFLYPEQLEPARDHWQFGYETGRIARSIVLGKGFSSPLFGDTGPTAWMTPAYPYLVALVFKAFGIYTKASALFLLSLNAIFSALTCVPVFFLARRSFGERVARWSTWAWAFFPYGIYFPAERIWETWLATFLLTILFLWGLFIEDSTSLKDWGGWGFRWGIAALVSPAVLAALPFWGLWILYRRRQKSLRSVPHIAMASLLFITVVSPWFVRNYRVFHRFIPFRDNMGIVLLMGTRGNSDYWGPYELGPWHNDADWREFQRLGEIRYMEAKKRYSVDFIRANPGWFAWTSVRRAVYLWTGYWSFERSYLQQEPLDPPNILFSTTFTVLTLLGLRKAFRAGAATAMPYLLVLFSFPLIYYFTSPEVYYRRPIDPIMVVLAVYGVIGSEKEEPENRKPGKFARLAETPES
jgi:Dolichyl-phosphate-mannose-protein mannosyltransferase